VALFRRKKSEDAADGTMSLMEHLYELRRRLSWAAAFIVVGTVIGFIWFSHGISAIGLKSLDEILIGPYCSAKQGQGCELLATSPFAGISLQIKASLMAGLVFSSPGWLYEIWAFVTPALYSKEKRYAITFVSLAALLFTIGAVLAYAVIGEGLKVLMGFASNAVNYQLGPTEYYSFLMTLLVVFGISFELPLFLIALNFVGVVKGRQLAKWRRYAIFAMFVFAAMVVPGNDPITMLALALAMTFLYEISVQVAKLHDKRKKNASAASDYSDLDDDVASPISSEQA
jgi:sec-independent protein translocase protein TatC